MKIDYPKNFNLDSLNKTFLWRYIDLSKLLDLILNEQIFFARLDKFEDGLEGLTGRNRTIKYINLSSPLTEENINKRFNENEQKRLIENDKTLRQKYLEDLSNSQETQFASCWYYGIKESIAMWKIYSKNDGVAVKFNAQQLITSLKTSAENYTNTDFDFFFFGPVDYKNIWPFDPHESFDGKYNAFTNRKAFSL